MTQWIISLTAACAVFAALFIALSIKARARKQPVALPTCHGAGTCRCAGGHGPAASCQADGRQPSAPAFDLKALLEKAADKPQP